MMVFVPAHKYDYPPTGTRVYGLNAIEYGVTTGGTRKCQMEGCLGRRYGVRWPDGKMTWPCSKGLRDRDDGSLQIG